MRGAIALALVCVLPAGCGLVFNGPHQQVRVFSEPRDAAVSFSGWPAKNGEPLRISRRSGWHIVRAERAGYQPACKLLPCPKKVWVVILDSIPAALPLFFDLAAGTLQECPDTINVTLDPLELGDLPYTTPSDQQIWDALEKRVDLCNPPPEIRAEMQFKARNLARARQIHVTSGDLSKPYEILGRVDQRAGGYDYWTGYSWAIRGIGGTQLTHHAYKADPTILNEMLQLEAIRHYGQNIDAIINVHYETLPDNDVSAGGLAVRFTGER